MIGTLDSQVIEKFKEFQKKTGKYSDLDIEEVKFEKKNLKDIHQHNKVTVQATTTADKFIEIGDIDRKTKKYDISKKIKPNLPKKGKHAPKGTILVSRVRPLLGGYTIIDDDDYTFTSGDLNPIVLPDKIDVDYVFKIICSPKFEIFLKKNQNISGQKPTITSKLYDFDIPIPVDYSDIYKSIDIQRAIVDFLDFSFDYIKKIRNNIDKHNNIVSRLQKSLIPSVFKQTAIEKTFDKYAKEKGINFKITDIEFDIKRIYSENTDELVCKKRMGFTPKTVSNGDINWFTVKDLGKVNGLFINFPETNKKTSMKLIKEAIDKNNTGKSEKLIPIKKGDILVSFKLTVGIVKIYNSNKPAYCNEAIDILTANDDIDNKYFAYNCIFEYPKYGTRTNNGITLNDDSKKEIKIFIPKPLNNHSSYDIQKILAQFISNTETELQEKHLKKINRAYDTCDRLNRTYLARTFTLINWSEE